MAQQEACQAHNLKVEGSKPSPVINIFYIYFIYILYKIYINSTFIKCTFIITNNLLRKINYKIILSQIYLKSYNNYI